MSKNSQDLYNSTYAFIFLSNKSHPCIAPFEAILCDLAKKHKLDFASTFSKHYTKPNKLYFFVRPALDSATPTATNNDIIISFANALSENLPLSMDFVFREIKNAGELTNLNLLPKTFNNTPPKHTESIPTVLQTKALLCAFENAIKATNEGAKSSQSTPHSQSTPKNIPNTLLDSLNSALKPFFKNISFDDKKIDFTKQQKATTSSNAKSSKSIELIYLISKLSQLLAQGKAVRIATSRGDIELSTQKPATKENLVMFFELGAIQSYMRVNQAQISLLGSFEKPSMKLCPKEVFAKEFFTPDDKTKHKHSHIECAEIECILAFEPMLALLGISARMLGIDFVFVTLLSKSSTKSPNTESKKSKIPKSSHKKSLDFTYTLTYTTPAHKRIACNKDGIYIEDKRTKLNLFSLIRKHYAPLDSSENATKTMDSKSKITKNALASQMLVIYLSKSKNTAIWIYSQIVPQRAQNAKNKPQQEHKKDSFSEILHIDFSLNPALILEQLTTYQNGEKLLANFKAHFGENALDFSKLDSLTKTTAQKNTKKTTPNTTNDNSQNLIEFFSTIAKILGYCPKESSIQQGIESVLNNAKLFLRDKGPRIDYKTLKTPQNRLTIDIPKILQSAISFALAGVDSATLCYGLVDSLCEFMGNLARDMEQNYGIKKVFLCGDMLTESIFLDKILHYIPKDLEIILPQDGFVDTL